jgi:hypothetical protein
MNDDFELPVTYKGKEMLLTARLKAFQYTYKIEVEIDGSVIIFEADEERNWRVLAEEESGNKKPDPELLRAVIHSLDQHTK